MVHHSLHITTLLNFKTPVFNFLTQPALRYLTKLLLALILITIPAQQALAEDNVLILGDSLSAGYGIDEAQGWVALLQKKLNAETEITRNSYNVINASISGETSAGGLRRLPALIEQYSPFLVVIELGGNDGLRGYPLQRMKANLQTMIAHSKEANAQVLLLGMQIPPNYGQRYSRQFADVYQQLKNENGVSLVDFFLANVGTVTTLMQKDGIHPTAAGQPIMLNNVWPTFTQYLKN